MLDSPVQMLDPMDGGRPIDLAPSIDIWLAVEKTHGGKIGRLFLDAHKVEVSLAMQIDLLFRCARAAGSTFTWKDMCDRVHRLGLYRTTDLVLELFADLFVPQSEPEGESAGEGEGTPLASGVSAT